MNASYELLEVAFHELDHLRDSLKNSLPDSVTVFGFVDIHMRYGPLDKVKLKFYIARDKKFKSFCCIISKDTKEGVPSLSPFWNPTEIKDEEIGRLCSNLTNWSWNRPFVLLTSSYDLKLRFDSLIKEKLLQTDLKLSKDFSEETCKGVVMFLSKEDYRDPTIPSGYIVKPIPASLAATMFANWSFNFSETEEQLAERLRIVGGVGAFRINSSNQNNDSDSLVSWAQQYTSGMIGMTYTVPEERRKGLASAVILTVAKKVLDVGGIAFAIADNTNANSVKFHQSLGFKVVGTSGFSLYLPVGISLTELSTYITNLH